MKAEFFAREGFVEPGDLCFDIGVRDGRVTTELLKLGAEVVCVEPLSQHVKQMQEKFGDAITIVEAAVSFRDGYAQLYQRGANKGSSTLRPDVYSKQVGRGWKDFRLQTTVETMTLDALVELFGFPMFIKLDIEGSEYWALKGLTFPVPVICFEWGGGYRDEALQCVELLGERGYEFNYVQGHKGDWQLPLWVEADGFEFVTPKFNEDAKLTWGNVFARLNSD